MINSTVFSTSLLSGAAVIVLGACTTPEQTQEAVVTDAAKCSLSVEWRGRAADVLAKVHSAAAISGTYRLSVSHSGSGGASQISQGGQFDLPAGGTATLASLTVTNPEDLSGQMEIASGGETFSCGLAEPAADERDGGDH